MHVDLAFFTINAECLPEMQTSVPPHGSCMNFPHTHCSGTNLKDDFQLARVHISGHLAVVSAFSLGFSVNSVRSLEKGMASIQVTQTTNSETTRMVSQLTNSQNSDADEQAIPVKQTRQTGSIETSNSDHNPCNSSLDECGVETVTTTGTHTDLTSSW